MKLIRKSLVTLLALAGLLFLATPAKAQFFGGLYGSQTLSAFPAIFTNAAAYTFTTPPPIYVPNGQNVAFQLSGAGSNTMTTTLTVAFARSLDGANWDTANLLFLPLTMAGTSQLTISSNYTIGAVGYIAPLYVTNANAYFATNCVLRYSLKPGY